MGIMDKRDEFLDKGKQMASEHGDKVDQGIDKAAEFADEKTGGKYSDKIDQGADRAKDATSSWGDR